MADYATLKAAIQAVIYENGNQEITGSVMQATLLAMVNSLGANYQYAGIATPSTNPGTPDQNVFYLASTAGTYVNFDNIVLAENEVAILKYNGSWTKEATGFASYEKIDEIDAIINGAEKTVYENVGEADYYKNAGWNATYYGIGTVTPLLPESVKFNRIVTPYICSGGAQRFKYAIVESTTVSAITPSQQTIIQTGEIDVTAEYARYNIELQNVYETTPNRCIWLFLYSEGTTSTRRVYMKTGGDGYPIYNTNSQRFLFITTSGLVDPFSVAWSRSGTVYIGPSPVLELKLDSIIQKVNDNAEDIAELQESVASLQEEMDNIVEDVNETLYENVGEIAYYDENGSNNTDWGIGAFTPLLLNGGDFNTLITPKIRQNSLQTLKYAIVESTTVGAITPSQQTIIQTGELTITSEYAQYEIKLTAKHTVLPNHCVAILFYTPSTTSGTRPTIRGLAGGTDYQNSQRYIFLHSSGVAEPFNSAWSRASNHYICPSPILKLIEPSIIKTEIVNTVADDPEFIVESIMPAIADEIGEMVADEVQELNKVIFNLAEKYYAVVGDTLQLFFQSIVGVIDISNYDIYVYCAVGKCYARYFEYTPVASNIGSVPFTIFVRDKNGTLLGQASTVIQTVAVPVSPGTAKNIFTFGDSLTTGGYWPCEAARRLLNTNTYDEIQGNGISNIVFRGTKTATKRGQTTNYFGVGGWTWNSYISPSSVSEFRFYVSGVNNVSIGDEYTNNGFNYVVAEINLVDGAGEILCTTSASTNTPQASGTLTRVSGDGDATITYSSYILENANPLWDTANNKMSFIPYVAQCGASTIDAVFVLLTWNGMAAWRNYSENDASGHIANAKVFARTLHTEYPNAKLKIMGIQMPSITGGLGANYSGSTSLLDRFGLTYTAISYNMALKKMCALTEFAPYCEFVDIAAQFDTLYNMPYSLKPVNARYPDGPTEKIGTNGVHPAERGYYQIADAVYRNIVANYCQ